MGFKQEIEKKKFIFYDYVFFKLIIVNERDVQDKMVFMFDEHI